MNKTKRKKDYFVPSCIIVHVTEASNLLGSSFPGQHNPAQPGATYGDAKQSPAWQEAGEEYHENFSGWKD